MKVTGIGGVFFRAKDPAIVTDWYEKHLGINRMEWAQQQGPTVFAPFPADTDYFGSESQNFMINFRVDDLDGMLTLLKNDLVDELRLKIFPVTIGTGQRLFAEGTIPAAFELIDSQALRSGVILANYKRSGEFKTGSLA